jgi:hypothetical protein
VSSPFPEALYRHLDGDGDAHEPDRSHEP